MIKGSTEIKKTPGNSQFPCPLCKNNDMTCLEVLRAKDIKKLYESKAAISIDDELSGIDEIRMSRCCRCQLITYTPPVNASGVFYERLQRLPDYYEDDKPEYQIAAEWLRRCHSVLEVGCGTAMFAKQIPNASYVGLEMNKHAAAQARSKGLTISTKPIEEYAGEHPDSFDAVCMFQVLEHITTPREFITSCAKCLKPGGLLVVAVPAYDSFIANATNHFLDIPPHHATRWTDDALRALSQIFPLDLVELVHEEMPPEHAKLCAQSEVYRTAYGIMGRKPPVIDLSPAGKIINLMARIIAKPSFIRNRIITHHQARGSRVACLYRRNS